MRGRNALLAILGAAGLAVFGAATAVATDHERDRNQERGGYVIPGSTVGVNPAAHPEFFGSPPNYECFERFTTYDSATQTYLGKDGRRRPCRLH
jgi:hypothetical protein